jgi:hypothetical protein
LEHSRCDKRLDHEHNTRQGEEHCRGQGEPTGEQSPLHLEAIHEPLGVDHEQTNSDQHGRQPDAERHD